MRVLIADDHPIVRMGVRELVLSEWPDAQIDEAATIEETCGKIAAAHPGLVVLDLVMPGAAGTEGVARVLALAGDGRVLVLSANEESAYAGRLLKMGVFGYVPKDRAGDELLKALRQVHAGRRYVTAEMAEHLADMLGGRAGALGTHEQLSTQEYRVTLLMAAGKKPAEIAAILGLSPKTVGSYRARIFSKMGWHNNVELAKYCVENGLTDRG